MSGLGLGGSWACFFPMVPLLWPLLAGWRLGGLPGSLGLGWRRSGDRRTGPTASSGPAALFCERFDLWLGF